MSRIIPFNINENFEDKNKIYELEELCKNNSKLSLSDIEILLKNLVYLVRKKISDFEKVSIKENLYTNKCDLAQSMIF